jgi:hypothetical protein
LILKKLMFVAALFTFALCGFVVGGIDLYETYDYWHNGRAAHMQSSDPQVVRAARFNTFDALIVEVTYVTPDGSSLVVPRKHVAGDTVRRLSQGQKIPVTFLRDEPERAYLDGRTPESPWVWLFAGAAFTVIALFALKLLKAEAAVDR